MSAESCWLLNCKTWMVITRHDGALSMLRAAAAATALRWQLPALLPADLGLGTMLWRPMSNWAGVIWGAAPAAGRAISSRFTAASNVAVSPATHQLQRQRPVTPCTQQSSERHPSSLPPSGPTDKKQQPGRTQGCVCVCSEQLRRRLWGSAPAAQVAAAAGSSCEARSRGAPANAGTAHRTSADWSYRRSAAATSGCGGGAESAGTVTMLTWMPS